jgi:outer membrane immunogenic protein
LCWPEFVTIPLNWCNTIQTLFISRPYSLFGFPSIILASTHYGVVFQKIVAFTRYQVGLRKRKRSKLRSMKESVSVVVRPVSKGAFVALLFAPVAAYAADIPPQMPTKAPVVAPIPYYNWTGLYVGLNGGGGWGWSKDTDSTRGITTRDFPTSGALFGGTVGYNYQVGNAVLGLEGDLGWARINGSSGSVLNGVNYSSYLQWLSSVRGRVGYAFDRVLPYVTGGLAVGGIKNTITTPSSAFNGTTTGTGWTVGAGVEYGITPSLSLKAEYLFADIPNTTPIPGNQVDVKTNIVRGGLNWRFNWDGPPHF